MKIAARFNPTNSALGAGSIGTGTFNATLRPGPGKLLVVNNSLYDIIFTFTPTSDQDIVPALTNRLFQLNLSNWNNIQWSTAIPIISNLATLNTSGTLVTCIVYEPSENVPGVASNGMLSSFSAAVQAEYIPQNLPISGTTTSQGTLTLTPGPGQVLYCPLLIVSVTQTNSSSDHADLFIDDAAIGGITIAGPFHINNVTNYCVPIGFSPAYNDGTTTMQLACTLARVAGSGVSVPCSVTAMFYIA